MVDVPPGNTPEDTRVFVDTIVRCNLQSLATTAEKLAAVSTICPPRASAVPPRGPPPTARPAAGAGTEIFSSRGGARRSRGGRAEARGGGRHAAAGVSWADAACAYAPQSCSLQSRAVALALSHGRSPSRSELANAKVADGRARDSV
ncbi:abscisic acid receptor PYL4 [Panicum miliaceum]|uniref:Abscisic acid receptor PYL4 n=1 Tax=Panicum miliaceum TaxID=4540 RepID=A0A3L6TPU3_PANMI|nr:abscisic acid receptor PYL4 [Panicum miliaceum]